MKVDFEDSMSNFDGDDDSMSNDYPEIKEDIHVYKNAFYINSCSLRPNLSNSTLDISHNTKSCPDIKNEYKTKNYDENQKSSEHSKTHTLSLQALREAINNLNLEGRWKILETPQGLIAAFTRKDESQDIFEKIDIAKVLGNHLFPALIFDEVLFCFVLGSQKSCASGDASSTMPTSAAISLPGKPKKRHTSAANDDASNS